MDKDRLGNGFAAGTWCKQVLNSKGSMQIMTREGTASQPLGTTVADRSLRIATALSAEVVVLRERLALLEMLMVERGLLGPEEIEAYRPSSQANDGMKAKRLSFLDRVFGSMRD